MLPQLDDEEVDRLLRSLGFNFDIAYGTRESSKEVEEYLKGVLGKGIPGFNSYMLVYRPNQEEIELTRTLTEGNVLVADAWKFRKRDGLSDGLSVEITVVYRTNGDGSQEYIPTNNDRVKSHDENLATILRAGHSKLSTNAPINERIGRVYNTLLSYDPTPNADIPRR